MIFAWLIKGYANSLYHVGCRFLFSSNHWWDPLHSRYLYSLANDGIADRTKTTSKLKDWILFIWSRRPSINSNHLSQACHSRWREHRSSSPVSDELPLDMLWEPAKPTDTAHVPFGQTTVEVSIRFIELVQAHSDLIGMIWVDRIYIIIIDT